MFKKFFIFVVIIIQFCIPTNFVFADDLPSSEDSDVDNSTILESISTSSNDALSPPDINSRSAVVLDRNSRKYFIW